MSADMRRPIILHADQEHSGLRLVVFLSLFVGLALGFWVVLALVDALAPPAVRDYRIFVSCIGAFLPALLLIWVVERVLKRVWHSGLSLELNERGVVVHDRSAAGDRGQRLHQSGYSPSTAHPYPQTPDLAWAGNLTQINWFFPLRGYPRAGQERRVPAKWLGVATELHQDGVRLNVYSLMPPERAAFFTDNPRLAFRQLNPRQLYATSDRARFGPPSRPPIPNELLHSKDGRYWLAERRRWEYGVELTPDDFATLMAYAEAHADQRPAASAASDVLSPI